MIGACTCDKSHDDLSLRHGKLTNMSDDISRSIASVCLTRNSFKYSFLSQCFSRDTNISYFHDRQLLRFGRHFEQVTFVSKIHVRSSRSALLRVSLYGQKLEERFSLVGNNRQHSFKGIGEVKRF